MGEDEKLDNAPEDEGEGEAPAEGGKTGGSFFSSKIVKILLYAVGGVLLLFLIAGISYVVAKNVQEKKYNSEQDIIIAPPPPPLSHYDLPTFSVTTNDPEPHFAKLTVSLGYEENMQLSDELAKRTPQMQHIVNTLLRGKGFEDLDSVEDSVNLSEEIKSSINTLLVNGKIKDVYFREFVVN